MFDYYYLKANRFKGIVLCFSNGYLDLNQLQTALDIFQIMHWDLPTHQSISQFFGHFVHDWMDSKWMHVQTSMFFIMHLLPLQVWVSEGGCVVWHSAVSFASFLAGKVGGGCDHEEVTRTYFGCSPYTELLVARSTCDKWSKTCVFNWMAVINLRLRDLFYFLQMHGAGGSILVHDHKGVQLAGVVSAMILMVVEGCSAGTAVSWLL